MFLVQPKSSTGNSNELLAKHFDFLADSYKREHIHKSKAFRNAAIIIKTFPKEIRSPNDLFGVKGIGESSLKEVSEFLSKGTSTRSQERQPPKEEKDAISLFKDIYGVGDVLARKFYEKGYRKLEDLRKEQLTNAQNLGLEHYHDLKERISRAEMVMYDTRIRELLSRDRRIFDFCLAGSFRRGEANSGDIDVLVKTNLLANEVKPLISEIIAATLSNGEHKFLGISQIKPGYLYRRLDICVFRPEQWATGILYNTGSDKFNVLLRERASQMGYKLNEFSLEGYYGELFSEEQIFQILGVKYIPPEERTREIRTLE